MINNTIYILQLPFGQKFRCFFYDEESFSCHRWQLDISKCCGVHHHIISVIPTEMYNETKT